MDDRISRRERLQKILARAGLGSRRACEEMIRQGRVTVNGEVAHLGDSADPTCDTIAVDGRPVEIPSAHTYILLHKPRGVLSTVRDTHGRPTVLDLVPSSSRLYPVGRLDMDSEGLMLLTDDGEVALRLTHPRYGHAKEYLVRVRGHPGRKALRRWREGIAVDGERTAPADVTVLRREADGTWLRVVLREGRKRLIRRVAEALGHPVQRLIRLRMGPLELGKLKPGEWRHLTPEEIAALRKSG
ncbi:MAG: pseudouridine synthase [Chloroflexia bacterium]